MIVSNGPDTSLDPIGQSAFEIHPLTVVDETHEDYEVFPWNREPAATMPVPLRVEGNGELVWAKWDADRRKLRRVAVSREAIAGFRVVQQRLISRLVMLVPRADVLVNGRPALRFSALAVKDSVVLAPGVHCYVTERVRPYVGKAPQSVIGKLCPFCRIPIDEQTHVVLCRCGAVYHDEPVQEPTNAAGDAEENEPLLCASKVRNCLVCSRTLTREEHLTWDPTKD